MSRLRPSLTTAWSIRTTSPIIASTSPPSTIAYRAASTSTTPPIAAGANVGAEGGVSRLQFIKLYKELHRLGRDYPDPNYQFNKRLRRAFEKNVEKNKTDPTAAKRNLELGEHVKKEVLALISLKKFRHLRRSYYPGEGPR